MQSNRFIRLLVTVTGSLLLCLLLLSPVLALDKNSVSTTGLSCPWWLTRSELQSRAPAKPFQS